MAEVHHLKPLANPGNGARDALLQLFEGNEAATDRVLAELWMSGFKIVPLEENGGADDPWHVPTMQLTHFKSWVGRKLWAIIDEPNGNFQVYTQSPDGVAPPSEYPTLRKAAARLLQLLQTGPVAPQTWPEEVCIGAVTTRKDEE